MNFIDHTGHTFTLKSYTEYPIGHEYIDPFYTFWLDGYVEGRKLSISNWYVKPIWILLDNNQKISSIELHSNIFWACTYATLKKIGLDKVTYLTDTLEIDEEAIYSECMHDGTYDIDEEGIDLGTCTVFPLYAFGKSEEEGTFSTDLVIRDSNDEWCPVAVSGEWHDETEELEVNAKNMGMAVPKEVLKAVYDTSFYSDVPDTVTYDRKLKEALLEYMHIKGECGNYTSAINSLEWFGYGDKIDFVKLMRTDNQFLATYIRDSFNSNSDVLNSFASFNNSQYVSVLIKENRETSNVDWQRWNDELKGEGKPFVEDLFMKVVTVKHDENDISFWKPFYDWNFIEMALKLSYLARAWKKYFLPLHTSVMSASLNRTVFANDLKHISKVTQKLTCNPIRNWNTNDVVRFSGSNVIYIYNQRHFIDEQFNEMTGYEERGTKSDASILLIDDICASIPIWFESLEGEEHFYDVNLLLTRNGHKVYESKFQFCQKKGKQSYTSFILSPNYIVNETDQKRGMSYWIDKKYRLSILCNGKWWYYDFTLKVPEFVLGLGTLKYNYFTTYESIDTDTKETFEEWLKRNGYDIDDIDKDSVLNQELLENWASDNSSQYKMSSMFKQVEKITDTSIDFNSFMYVPSLVEVNDICFYPKLENAMSLSSSSAAAMTSYREYLMYLASKCYVYDFGLETYRDTWIVGNSVVPLFKINNGIESGNISNEFKLEKFFVDVYFDIDTDNTYYAKVTYDYDELKELLSESSVIAVKHLKSYAAISDAVLVKLKERILGTDKGPVYKYEEGNQSIDWDATSLEWRQFYIDDYEKNRRQITIRIVWRGTVTGPARSKYNFGGYDSKNNPKEGYFKEERLNVNPNATSEWCEMECHSFCKGLCKFRKENSDKLPSSSDKTYNYDSTIKDKAQDSEKVQEIMSEVVQRNLNKMISQSSVQAIISKNSSYLNRVHIYDIYVGKKKWKYDHSLDIEQLPNGSYVQDKKLIDIYRIFFDDDGNQKIWIDKEDTYFNYDFYLMHDDDYWFGVFISQMTIDSTTEDNLNAPDKLKIDKLTLKRHRSGNRFLINRMMYMDASPTYKFTSDDLIVATIDNVNFPYILDKNAKWNIKPFSLGMGIVEDVQSTTNTAIFSIPKKANAHISGYYDVECRYSVDSNVNHQQIKKRRILIEK